MKLTNKDKQSIRQALYHQIEAILLDAKDEYGYNYSDLGHLASKDIAEYCYKVIGLEPSYRNGRSSWKSRTR